MRELNQSTLEEALATLGDLLDERGTPSVELVVVGGSALLATGIVSRSTEDVDILARRSEVDREIIDARPLPEFLTEAAGEVAVEFGFASKWLNASIALFALPFNSYPDELWQNGIEKEYGERLRVTFVGRHGLIYLKFHAAIDPRRARRKDDRADLVKLAPSGEEALRAIDWLLREELVTPDRKAELAEVLNLLNHGNLATETEKRLS